MVRTIGIISIKGGVGKTTISASLASDLVNHYGKKVLLVDGNYSAPNLGFHMDVVEPKKTIHDVLANRARIKSSLHRSYGVDVLPGNFVNNRRVNYMKLRDRISSLKKDYDFVIIDSSPSFNEEILSNVLASDNLFIVSTPDYPTLACSLKTAKLAVQRGKKVDGIIMNKIREPKYEINLREIEEATGIPVIARVPDDKNCTRAIFMRIPVSVYNRRCRFSKEISRLSDSLTGAVGKRGFIRKIFSKDFRKEEVNRQILKESFYERSFS